MPSNPDPPDGGTVPLAGRPTNPEETARYIAAAADFRAAMDKIVRPLYPELVGREDAIGAAVIQACFGALFAECEIEAPVIMGALGMAIAGALVQAGPVYGPMMLDCINRGARIAGEHMPPIFGEAAGHA